MLKKLRVRIINIFLMNDIEGKQQILYHNIVWTQKKGLIQKQLRKRPQDIQNLAIIK